MQLSEKDTALVHALTTHFYDIVPHEYKTYCARTARIMQAVLLHFGIDAKLLPCQVWLTTEGHNYVVGFLGNTSPAKWDGHVVCRAKDLIIDAALTHFEKQFGLRVPGVVSSPCFTVPTQVISRCDLSAGACLWWHYPPASPEFDLNIPSQPREMIAQYATQLIAHIGSPAIARIISLRHGTAHESTVDGANS